MKITQSKEQTKSSEKQNESNIKDLWDNIKVGNLSIIRIAEEEKAKGVEIIFEEIMTKDSPYLSKEAYPGVQSTQCPKQDESQQFYNKPCYN